MLSELGYGCTALFGKNVMGKQGITDEQAFDLITVALESGISFYDTGFNYGYAEERLGKTLNNLFKMDICKREDVVIQTKGCETINEDGSYGPNDYSVDWIKRSIELSLNRLKVDYIDLYALHSAIPENISDGLIHLFEDLKSQGIIRAYGVAGISDSFGEWLCEHRCFDYVMMTYNYAEARRNLLINELTQSGIGIISGGSLNRSLSTFSFLPHSKKDFWYIARTLYNRREDLRRVRQFKFVNDVPGFTPQQVSLAYILNNKSISSAVFNTIKVNHLKENVDAANKDLPRSVIKKIEHEEHSR